MTEFLTVISPVLIASKPALKQWYAKPKEDIALSKLDGVSMSCSQTLRFRYIRSKLASAFVQKRPCNLHLTR